MEARMLKLYKSGNSICTQKVMITLREKGLEPEMQSVNLFLNEQYNPDYLKINPKGVVPSLVDDGKVIIESSLICEYLDETYPQPRLVPDDPYLRSKMRLWSKAIDEGIFEATREISFSAMFREKLRAMSPEQRETRFRNVGDPGRRDRYVSTYELGVASPYVLQAVAAYEKLFKNMESALGPGDPVGGDGMGGPWVLGEKMSLGDINLMPYVARINYLNLLDLWTADRPRVMSWWRRVQDVPSFRHAIADATSEADAANMKKHGTLIKEEVKARRAEYLASLHAVTENRAQASSP
jgi:glutathione S-transferase